MRRAAVPLLAGLAIVTTALSAWGLVMSTTGAGNLEGPFAQGLSAPTDTAAIAALNDTPDTQALARAEALSRQSLNLSPYSNQPRMQLAFIDVVRHGRLTKDGVQLIAQSYDLVPIDYTVARYRLKIALESWESLPASTQRAVRREAMAFARVGSQHVGAREVLDSVQNPPGRAIAAVWKSQLDYGGGDIF